MSNNTLNVSTISRVAAVDLSGSRWRLVVLNSSGQIALPGATTDRCIGVLQNAPTAGQLAEVMVFGITRCESNGAVAMAAGGVRIAPAATTGRAGQAASTNFVVGYSLEALGAQGTLFTMVVNPAQLPLA